MTEYHERILKYFEYGHLPQHLREVSVHFNRLANELCDKLAPSAERTVALRKLLESKDAAVRAKLDEQV